MKKNKSLLSILGAILLSLTVVSGTLASPPHNENDGTGGKPPSCSKAPCHLSN